MLLYSPSAAITQIQTKTNDEAVHHRSHLQETSQSAFWVNLQGRIQDNKENQTVSTLIKYLKTITWIKAAGHMTREAFQVHVSLHPHTDLLGDTLKPPSAASEGGFSDLHTTVGKSQIEE